jgi:hypothetical protein
MPGDEPKAHHYVQCAYLEGFCDPTLTGPPRLRIYSPNQPVRTQIPKECAVENYFYCFDEDGKCNFIVEKTLAEMESASASVLDTARQGRLPATATDRLTLAGYIALSIVRTPTAKKIIDQAYIDRHVDWLRALVNTPGQLEAYHDEEERRTGIKRDPVSQDLSSAESFTILIHGVGAEKSQDLLAEAKRGYLASGFGADVQTTMLPECPALSQEKGAEAILIKGQKGGHFVIAFPWNTRVRLASLAQNCLTVLSLMMTMTAAAYVIDRILPANPDGALNGFRSEVFLKIVFAIGHWWKWGPLLLLIFSFAQWTVTLWIPWLWVFACLLILALWINTSNVIIPCIPIARTKGWGLIFAMLVIAVTLMSAASVHTMWGVSKKISADNLAKPKLADLRIKLAALPVIKEFVQSLESGNAATITSQKVKSVSEAAEPEPTQDDPPVKGAESRNETNSKTDLATNSSKKAKIDKEQKDFVTCLIFILICISGIYLAGRLGYFLDFGLDVLHYGGDKKYNDRTFGRLSHAIRWLHSQAPNAHLTIVAHSLGTVIASQALSSISDSEPLPGQITLITLGSPLNYLYRVFPNVSSPRELSAAICSKARWINLWRRSDGIGRELDVEPGVLAQYCIGEGGHEDYWGDGAVWKAVVYESLKIGDFSGKVSPPGDPARCDMEVHLGLKAAQAIVLILLIGIVVWIVPYLGSWLLAFVKAHYHAPH